MSEPTPTPTPTPPDRPRPRRFRDSMIHQVTTSADSQPPPPGDPIVTPQSLLGTMRNRLKYYGAPLPEGYVPPPGIDIEALLKQVPWPPPAPGA